MPFGSELMYLPDRVPMLFNLASGESGGSPRKPARSRRAHLSRGGVQLAGARHHPRQRLPRERPRARSLPLFSYGAVGWLRGKFRSAAIRGGPGAAPGPAAHAAGRGAGRRQGPAPAHARQPAAAAPGDLRPALRLPGRQEFLPGPLRGPAADRRHLQRALPRLPVAAEEQRDQLHPGAHRLHPHCRWRSRRWRCFTSAG